MNTRAVWLPRLELSECQQRKGEGGRARQTQSCYDQMYLYIHLPIKSKENPNFTAESNLPE